MSVYTHTHPLYPVTCWWTLRLCPCLGCCKPVLLWTQGCVCAFELGVLFGHMPRSGTAGSYGNSYFCMFLIFFFFSFWPCCMAYEILVPWPGIEPRPLVVKAQNPNHWCAHTHTCTHTHTRVGICMHAHTYWSCTTLCDPMGCNLPGSSVHRTFQARILQWVAISYSRGIFPTQGSSRLSLASSQFFTPVPAEKPP